MRFTQTGKQEEGMCAPEGLLLQRRQLDVLVLVRLRGFDLIRLQSDYNIKG